MSNSVVSFKKRPKEKKVGERKENGCKASFYVFRNRASSFSLDLRDIRPSEFVGTRIKAALRIEPYLWAPVLRIFDKLREVGLLSYLSFTLNLSDI